ncbi:MAG: response regulator [Dehalococcoidia bacterium]
MYVRFWGTRGSLATPGAGTVRYGGNTSCVELYTSRGTLLILDCGSGARELGLSLMSRGSPVAAAILIGHTHWDHIQGFPFFAPVFAATSRFDIYAPSGGDVQLADVLAGQMEYQYFPVSIEQLGADISFHDLGEDQFTVGDAIVQTHYLNHTAVCLGYRITAGGRTVVYATDHEPHARSMLHGELNRNQGAVIHAGDRAHVEFLRGADLLIHDAQFTDAEYPARVGWGHSTMEYATDIAIEAGVTRLALFHHDPGHDDSFLESAVLRCQARARAQGSSLQVSGAAEGTSIDLPESVVTAVRPKRPRPLKVQREAQILIVDDDADVRELLHAALEKQGYQILEASTGSEALTLAAKRSLDLVLLDVMMPDMDGYTVCRIMRSTPNTQDVPIVMLTGLTDESRIQEAFALGATDFMAKPFAVAQVRARVQSWLLRRRDTN